MPVEAERCVAAQVCQSEQELDADMRFNCLMLYECYQARNLPPRIARSQ